MRIWDARTGAPLQHEDKVSSAAFHPTGERIVTRLGKTVRIWEAQPVGDGLLIHIRAILGKNAPEPLKFPPDAQQREGWQDYTDTIGKGLGIIWTWMPQTIGSL